LRNFYDMLSVATDAPPDEIKKAFRREIARYHPDKVQHLGQEFQEMAAGIAADLTEAYRILMDPALRGKYNEDLFGGPSPSSPRATRHHPPAGPEYEPPPPQAPFSPSSSSSSSSSSTSPWADHGGPAPPPPRPSSGAGVDFVKRASLSRVRTAVEDVMGNPEAVHVSGFDLAVDSKPKRGLFKKAEESVRLLVKFVPLVDPEAIAEVWVSALKGKVADATLCVLLVGSGLAPSKDLATAISEQRRKSRNAGPVLVPVDVRDWEALFPPDTPASVRSLIQRLREEKR
jgi:curved DNA-binding protein CbpA